MKKILLLLALSIHTMVFAQQTTAKDAFLEKWENSKNYLLEMAEIMLWFILAVRQKEGQPIKCLAQYLML